MISIFRIPSSGGGQPLEPYPGLFTAATGARESPDPKTQFWPLAPFATA
jgi:hypothetical protein